MLKLLALCATAVAALAVALPQPAGAVAMRPDKTTDDSVCDLSPRTTSFVAGYTFIPSIADYKDQVAAYFRLPGEFVAKECHDGQLLILWGMADLDTDVAALTELANSSCSIATVSRSNFDVPFMYGETRPGFELRCPISKHAELVQKLARLEAEDPIESLKARMVEAVQRADARAAATRRGGAADSRQDCGKIPFGALIGLAGGCKPSPRLVTD